MLGDKSSPVEKVHFPIPEIKVTIEDSPPLSEQVVLETTEQQVAVLREFLGQSEIRLHSCACALYLRGDNSLIGVLKTGYGSLKPTILDAQLVIATGLKARASKVVICYSFPQEVDKIDVSSFTGWKTALGFFEMEHLDYIIITPDSYLSAVKEGIIIKEE